MYGLIHAERENIPVACAGRVLRVSRSGYYKWLQREPSERSMDDVALAAQLAEVCIRRPIFASMLVSALLAVGATGYFKLGLDRFPAVDLPVISIRTALPGASPGDVEAQISDEVESVVNAVEGITELRSVSSNGISTVRRAIAVVVIGGQTLSLLLTLVVTPVTYSLFEDLREALRSACERRLTNALETSP